ncbi:MAG TPA: hypothetical protein VJH87_17275 [Vicinamibacteria bacterium]|nr:hypothetical protein [Vicinamibacteria bacterium]
MENLYAPALAVLLGAAVIGAVGQRVLCHRERRRFPPPAPSEKNSSFS